ncbi:MAG TPA: cytochrome c biogenesis protein CcsA [candidate division Zixibacteria bacterium]|nr:cytochrome c biogenesis protein CcsA [candidate division Zixibacteria bacterium]
MALHVTGELLIILAFAFNLLAGVAYFLVARGRDQWESLARLAYGIFVGSVAASVALLFYLFFSHNFAFKYVFEYSDSSLPLGYLISSFWGGQEGTYLLWLFFNSLFGFLILKFGHQYRHYAMAVMASVNAFFIFILMRLSPFALMDFLPPDGAGLNELLQDPWMVIHPPTMFSGYSIAAVPFAIAMAALIRNDYSRWMKTALPWVGITALALGAGNIMGGYWAYKTLGWGGYWAWDPVENSSFVPWFTSLALLHGMIIERRTGALRKINMLMTSLLFLEVVYGTFLTRSGVLADFSVHSFVDLGTTGFLVAFLAFFTLMTLVLFITRIKALGHVPMSFNFYGREFSLIAATGLLFIFSMIVMFWMSLPLTTQLIGVEPRAADLATYNSFALPFAVLYALLLAVVPFTSFTEFRPAKWIGRFLILAIGSLAIGFLPMFLGVADSTFGFLFAIVVTTFGMYTAKPGLSQKLLPSFIGFVVVAVVVRLLGVANYTYLLFFATGAMAIISNATYLAGFFPNRWRFVGAHLSHFGFGLLILGVLASSAFVVSEKVVIPKGESRTAFGMEIEYDGMEHGFTYPQNRLLLSVHDDGDVDEIHPQLYYSPRMNGIMRRPTIQKTGLYDLYYSPEEIQMNEGYGGLKLAKGEQQEVGDYKITFDNFDMGDHGMSGDMQVGARLIIETDDVVDTVVPIVAMVSGPGGQHQESRPASFDNGAHEVSIEGILADERAVVINIPGLTKGGRPEMLVLDISRKMLIDLVWLGAIFLLGGVFISFLRRKEEAEANSCTTTNR